MCVILLAKAIWVAVNDAEVAEKVWTVSIIARKSRMDMEICCGGGADVLGPCDAVGVGGTDEYPKHSGYTRVCLTFLALF